MQFVCRLGTADGRVVEERHQAQDPQSLRSELERRGYHVFEVKRPGLMGAVSLPTVRRRRKVRDEDFLIFNQELAALLRAGLPLLEALNLMLERMKDPRLRPVLMDIRDRVKTGEDLSSAFAAYGDMFPRLYASSLKAGERSGELELVIRRFIGHMRLILEARKKVISALVYPSVLICLSLAMMTVMGLYVVPKFSQFYADLNAKLPALTRFTLGAADFVHENWLILLAALAGAAVMFWQWRATEAGALQFDHLRMKVPLVGSILHRFGLVEFCRALSTLLAGGIPLVPASEIATSSVSNSYLRSKLEPTINLVREGKPFHQALEQSGIFTDMAIDMVKVGEATGALDEMLGNVGDFLDEQVAVRMQRLLSLVEPAMLVIMGLIIGVLLISIYLPLFSVMTQVGN